MDDEGTSPTPHEALLRAIPAFVAHVGLDGRILYLNRFAPGFSAAQIQGKTIFDFTPTPYHGEMRACLARAIETRQPCGYSSVAAADARGERTHYYTLFAPILEADRVTSIVALATDVSGVTGAHRALQESETKLRLVLAATGMGIWSFDPVRQEGGWDATAAQVFGYPADTPSLSMAQTLEHIHPDDRERVAQEIARAFVQGSYGPIEHRIVGADGKVRWVSASGRVQGEACATPGALVGGVIDITERRLQEERLAQAQRMDSIGRLAGGVAHDFNNMLTAILGYADMCLAGVTPGTALAEDLGEIRLAAERSRALTTRLLAFARKQRADLQVVDPNELVQQVERLLDRILGEDVALTAKLVASRNIRADEHQLEQLLLNLVSNARDAMPRGGRLVIETSDLDLPPESPELGDLMPGAYVRFRVIDTGQGIPPDVLEHVFEPFFTTKGQGLGTGLGLAQCYGIARQHDGQVRITSEVGRGTVVTLDIPAVRENTTPRPPGASPHGPGGAETILLVEDEAVVRALTARVLREHGYRVLEAANGDEALLAAAENATEPLHLLLTDMVMPGLTGMALAELLARARPGLAVVVMSGYAEQLADAHHDQPATFLGKPFRPAELLAKVELALRRR